MSTVRTVADLVVGDTTTITVGGSLVRTGTVLAIEPPDENHLRYHPDDTDRLMVALQRPRGGYDVLVLRPSHPAPPQR